MPASERMPAEWEPHRATWLAFPSHPELWREDLAAARREFGALCHGIGAPGGAEALEILVPSEAAQRDAAVALRNVPVRFHRVAFGDIWLRDTAPSFTVDAGVLGAVRFRFNGWGHKYELEGDAEVGGHIARIAGAHVRAIDLTLEGGAVEVDGEGTVLTTRQCVLSEERNPHVDEQRAAGVIAEALGAERVVWLDRGLLNDHTDGHIDTLARFVAPGVVACMEARTPDDPNREVLAEIAGTLSRAVDARGRRLELVTLPSPGAVLGRDGDVMPASYLNFYVANRSVVVPTYGSTYDDEAVSILARCFPGRAVSGSPARAILSGGGAFHCITQQEPLTAAAD